MKAAPIPLLFFDILERISTHPIGTERSSARLVPFTQVFSAVGRAAGCLLVLPLNVRGSASPARSHVVDRPARLVGDSSGELFRRKLAG